MRAIVIGADGTLLGYTGHVDVPNLNIGQPFDPGIYQDLEAPFTAAMAGETDAKYLYSVFGDDKRFLMALPIFDEAGGKENQVVGVIVVVLELFPTQSDIPAHILNIAGRSLIIFLLSIGIMGQFLAMYLRIGFLGDFNRISTITDLMECRRFLQIY